MKWLMALAIAGTCSFAQPAEVRRWADHWAGEYGVERELVYAVIEVESGGDARAISSGGAAGVMGRRSVAFRLHEGLGEQKDDAWRVVRVD